MLLLLRLLLLLLLSIHPAAAFRDTCTEGFLPFLGDAMRDVRAKKIYGVLLVQGKWDYRREQ